MTSKIHSEISWPLRNRFLACTLHVNSVLHKIMWQINFKPCIRLMFFVLSFYVRRHSFFYICRFDKYSEEVVNIWILVCVGFTRGKKLLVFDRQSFCFQINMKLLSKAKHDRGKRLIKVFSVALLNGHKNSNSLHLLDFFFCTYSEGS